MAEPVADSCPLIASHRECTVQVESKAKPKHFGANGKMLTQREQDAVRWMAKNIFRGPLKIKNDKLADHIVRNQREWRALLLHNITPSLADIFDKIAISYYTNDVPTSLTEIGDVLIGREGDIIILQDPPIEVMNFAGAKPEFVLCALILNTNVEIPNIEFSRVMKAYIISIIIRMIDSTINENERFTDDVRKIAMNQIEIEVQNVDSKFSEIIRHIKNHIDQVDIDKNSINAFLDKVKFEYTEVKNEFHENLKVIESRATEASDKAIEEIGRVRDAQIELTKIRPTVAVWDGKAKSHRHTSFFTAIAFGILIILSFAAIFVGGPTYVSGIVSAVGERQVLASTLIIAPILGIAWILRLLSRFLIQNLASWDDARQRSAMADTYLSLLTEKDQPMTKEERALALNALFRASATTTESDVNPPSFIDLVTPNKN